MRDDEKQRFNLTEMQELTPAPNPVEAMRKQLALAAFGGVSEADMIAMVGKLKEKAMAGDLRAMDMFFKLTLPDKPAEKPVNIEPGLKAVADAITELVDEVRVTKFRQEQKQLTNGNGTEAS